MAVIEKQRGTYDCALCSVAMALGRSPEALFAPEVFAKAEETKSANPSELLASLGLVEDRDFWSVYVGSASPKGNVLDLLQGRRALLQVQSLNNPPPAMHIIYWDGQELRDPSNKQVYRWLRQCTSVGYVTIFNDRAADLIGLPVVKQ